MRTIIKVGGSMIGFAYTAYSIASSYYVLPPLAPWGKQSWVGVGIGFVIFAGFVFWGWGEASWKLRQHENIHPTVNIEPICVGKVAYLKIVNTGHQSAKFEVKFYKWDGLEKISHEMESSYNGRWELFNLHEPNEVNSELKSCGSNRIKVIEDAGDASIPRDNIKYRKVSIPDSRAETFWEAKVKTNEVIRFMIQVLSEPALKKPFQQSYMLSINEDGQIRFED
jgi:hypothetical protein